MIWLKVGQDWQMFALTVDHIADVLPQGGSQCFPFYTYAEDGSNRRENITDWALQHFRDRYQDSGIGKWDIFYYVYGMLHHPTYRARYASNLKRELPRVPLAPDFWSFSKIGAALAELHLHYEQAKPYRLRYEWVKGQPIDWRVQKMKLAADKCSVRVNDTLTLHDIPADALDYRLGNRSALEWVIDQYQVNGDSDPNAYAESAGLSQPERYIVELVQRIVTVSVETVRLVRELEALDIG